MVGGQREQQAVHHEDVLEVVDDALAVQKVHCGAEEVPVERLGEAQAARLAGDVGNGNDLLEGYDLDGRDDDDDEEVAGAEGPEEAGNHDQRPYCARDEVCLFLLILGLGHFWDLPLSAKGDRIWGRRLAYWDGSRAVGRGAAGLVLVLGLALRQSAGAAIAGAPLLVVELDVLAWARHGGGEAGCSGRRAAGGRRGVLRRARQREEAAMGRGGVSRRRRGGR